MKALKLATIAILGLVTATLVFAYVSLRRHDPEGGAAGQPTDAHGRFVNLDGSRAPSLWSIDIWAVIFHDVIRGRRNAGGTGPGIIVVDREQIATPPETGARLTWLGHSSWLVQIDGVSLLIDPNFADALPQDPRVTPLPISPDDLPRIDAVLVSHSHHDHFDVPSVQRTKARVIAGLRTAQVLAPEGVSFELTELGWWSSTNVGGVTVHFVPSQHSSRRTFFDEDIALWGGFVIEGPSTRIYHSGDTAYFAGFKEIGARFGRIDTALLPIGAYEPEWYCLRDHVTPEQAVQAFVDLQAQRLFGMHWGTFKLSDEPLDEPPKRMATECARRSLTTCRALSIGETVQ